MRVKVVQLMLTVYLLLILVGTLVLMLPSMHNGNLSLLDALFTATSAITCTGLIVKNTELDFTFSGQIAIATMIQIGGFGYMSLLGILYIMVGKKLNNTEKNMIKESLNHKSSQSITKAVKNALLFMIVVESIGALILSLHFKFNVGLENGIWHGIFHAISAFNNAGFSTFSSSIVNYRTDIVVNLILCSMVIIGGLGCVTFLEFHSYTIRKIKQKILKEKVFEYRLSLNSKVILISTIILIFSAAFMILIFEWNNKSTLSNMGFFEKIISSIFASVMYRTAGFNSFDLNGLEDSTIFFSTIFMSIGGAPGGTANGIKVTTAVILLAFSYSIFKDMTDTIIFKRKIPQDIISKAFTSLVIASLFMFTTTFFLSVSEPNIKFLHIFFEVASAFATVGVSIGDGGDLSLSAGFSAMGVGIIILLMITGKIGILSFMLIFMFKRKARRTQYIQERILI